ncbi:MAG: hypothetical protein Q8M92_03200, partial [Candidatus Subteraquimicrobiales bacterium]|nr:hypothetical protein [Candidatus Subteraquimicrobiales bacterium]
MLKILKKLKEDKSYNNLLEKVSREKMVATFVPSFLRPFVAAGIYEELKESIVVLTPTLKEAEEFYESISNFTSQAVLFPDREVLLWEKLIPNKEILAKRVQVLYKVQTEPIIVIVAVQTFIQEIPHFKLSLLEPLTLKEGKKSEFSYLLEKLVRMGYERTLLVENRGEFSVRGGIVDIFDPLMEHPVRIEFFGDEIVSLRHFSVASQCSIATCAKIQIFPCRE